MTAMKRLVTLFAMACLFLALPARAQSILRDAETEALLNDMSRPLVEKAGLDPRNFQVVLINDPSINAFVAGGQAVYIHTGLLDKAESANEVQGVIAHEIGHIIGGHVPLRDRGSGPATGISILSLVLGIAAMAAGAGEAGAGILAAGQQAAMGSYLAFSRTQESSADAAGARLLRDSNITGKGFLSFFKKLQNTEYRLAIPQENSYNRTHPLSGERIANLTADVEASPAFSRPLNADLERRFKLVQAKLRGYVNDPQDTLRAYPTSNTSEIADYARAYAWHKSGYPDQARDATMALVRAEPNNPYFLELEGQILLESGKPRDAIAPLRRAVQLTNGQPLIATTLGHALIATEDKEQLDEAERVLRAAVNRDRENPFAWFQLGTVYERKGDRARTALATAERALMMGEPGLAMASGQTALGLLPQGSGEWLRAQDIVMVAQNALSEQRGRRRN
ncbi:M48 family metalloprotease [Sphingomonas sp. BGYR3]|uniref:M48 family metalloprotease n=1 Tax=Sphingomonas sp. BGYR3 TaxID=2975483 RepID=UPI0021A842B1|nr:M48 family metalloprotease [Sphingomonas sp. BGYR3]MDG5488357.1 M48 family metalloprotease [Sphingomonas sp. BGYR3]